jgi:hypothetical protein
MRSRDSSAVYSRARGWEFAGEWSWHSPPSGAKSKNAWSYEILSKIILDGHLERGLQRVELSAIRWVSRVSFAAVIICFASQQVFIVVSLFLVIDTVQKILDTLSYTFTPHYASLERCLLKEQGRLLFCLLWSIMAELSVLDIAPWVLFKIHFSVFRFATKFWAFYCSTSVLSRPLH